MFTTMIRNHMKTDIHVTKDIRGKTDLDSKSPQSWPILAPRNLNHWFQWLRWLRAKCYTFVKNLWRCSIPVCLTDSTIPCTAKPMHPARKEYLPNIRFKFASSWFIIVMVTSPYEIIHTFTFLEHINDYVLSCIVLSEAIEKDGGFPLHQLPTTPFSEMQEPQYL